MTDLFSFITTNPLLTAALAIVAYVFFFKSDGSEKLNDLLKSIGDPDLQKLSEILRSRLSDADSRDQTIQLVETLKTETAGESIKSAKSKR